MKRPGSFFSADGAGFRFLSTASSLVILNLLWVLCCIPLITAGAATSALYAVIIQMIRGEDAYIAKSFFGFHEAEFKAGYRFVADASYCGRYSGFGFIFQQPGSAAGGTGSVYSVCYARGDSGSIGCLCISNPSGFENSIKRTLKNALFMGLAYLPFSVLAAVLALGPFAVLFVFSEKIWTALFFDLVVGFAFFAWVRAHIFVRLFQKYLQKE